MLQAVLHPLSLTKLNPVVMVPLCIRKMPGSKLGQDYNRRTMWCFSVFLGMWRDSKSKGHSVTRCEGTEGE
jgi:hypothetical protein